MAKAKSKSHAFFGAVWRIIKDNLGKPSSFDVAMSLAKSGQVLSEIKAIYDDQARFEKRRAKIDRLFDQLSITNPSEPEYHVIMRKLDKLLK